MGMQINMNRRTFLKLTGVAGASLVLPAISSASTKTDAFIFDYHKPFELEAVYVFFGEDHVKEYSIALKDFESEITNNSELIYQYWPKGTNPDWENNSMVYVSKDRDGTTGWWTKQGFKDYFNKIIQKRYPNKNFHHSESGVANWGEKPGLKHRITYLK